MCVCVCVCVCGGGGGGDFHISHFHNSRNNIIHSVHDFSSFAVIGHSRPATRYMHRNYNKALIYY